MPSGSRFPSNSQVNWHLYAWILALLTLLSCYATNAMADEIIDFRTELTTDRLRIIITTEWQLAITLETDDRGTSHQIAISNLSSNRLGLIAEQRIGISEQFITQVTSSRQSATLFSIVLTTAKPAILLSTQRQTTGSRQFVAVIDVVFDEGAAEVAQESGLITTTEPHTAVPAQDVAPSPSVQRSREARAIPPSEVSEATPLWLDVTMNQVATGILATALQLTDDSLAISSDDISRLGIQADNMPTMIFEQQSYVPLAQTAISYHLNLRELSVDLQVPPRQLGQQRVRGKPRQALTPVRNAAGLFANYDLNVTRNETQGSDADIFRSGFTEAGVFNRFGVGTTQVVVRDFPNEATETVRLNSTWRADFPANMTTLTLGDSLTATPGWARSTRFAGIQWGRNFATQPTVATTPFISLTGEATLPSTVDLYINGMLRLSEQVQPGPFALDEVPSLAGFGEARLVIRDILGREQVVTDRFLGSNELLRPGLTDFSIAAGVQRENFAQLSNDYSEPLVSGFIRHGVTHKLTLQSYTEGSELAQLVGSGLTWSIPGPLLVNANIAASHSDQGTGELWQLGLQHRRRQWSVGADWQQANEQFRSAAVSGNRYPSEQLSTFASFSSARYGSLQFSYTLREQQPIGTTEFISARYSKQILRSAYLSLSAVHFPLRNESNLRLNFSMPLGGRLHGGLNISQRQQQQSAELRVQRGAPIAGGIGFQAQAGLGDRARQRGSVRWLNPLGELNAEAETRALGEAQRLSWRGGASWFSRRPYLHRFTQNSFGLVDAPGLAKVDVYAGNQRVATTNRHGRAFIPRLRAYEINRIQLDGGSLPITTAIESLSTEVIPYARHGVHIPFAVSPLAVVTATLVDSDGRSLAVGSLVEYWSAKDTTGDRQNTRIGYDGMLYLTDIPQQQSLNLRVVNQNCSMQLTVPATEDWYEAGVLTCE